VLSTGHGLSGTERIADLDVESRPQPQFAQPPDI